MPHSLAAAPAASRRPRRLVLAPLGACACLATAALAQPGADAAASGAQGVRIWALFTDSFDLFTVLIVAGSIASVAIIVRSLLVVRRSILLPEPSLTAIKALVNERRWPDLQKFVAEDPSFVGRVLAETLPKVRTAGAAGGAAAIREVVEIGADNESARRFKEVDLLGTLGNLGPLLGLVGTVWGMIIAFTAIGETGGQAAAAQLSIGIAKALFHTFLGLTLAIPSLLAFGVFRERLDRLCTEGTMFATDTIDAIAAALVAGQNAPGAPGAPAGASAQARPAVGIA